MCNALLLLLLITFEEAKSFTLLPKAIMPLLPQSVRRIALKQAQADFDDEHDFTADYTGIEREIYWKPFGRPIPLQAEIDLLQSGDLLRRGEFNYLTGDRVDELTRTCKELGMTAAQGLIIRKQVLVTNVVQRTWELEKNLDKIERTFRNQQQSILELALEFNLPPVSIIRAVLRNRVDDEHPDWGPRDCKKLVKIIISDKGGGEEQRFLSEWERQQLQIAKENDAIGYQKEVSEIYSDLWEEALYTFLEEQKINYVSETEMRQAGSRITPDCLLLDNVIINGHPVRWIDAKSFYASGLRESAHTGRSIKKQIAKYGSEYGESGAVIFKHGFSKKLQRNNPDALFLDAGPLATAVKMAAEY